MKEEINSDFGIYCKFLQMNVILKNWSEIYLNTPHHSGYK